MPDMTMPRTNTRCAEKNKMIHGAAVSTHMAIIRWVNVSSPRAGWASQKRRPTANVKYLFEVR